MPRIRSVKPEFFSSVPVGNCSPTSRLLFVALWCYADDEGRSVDDARIIRAFAFPLDDAILSTDVDRMLNELQTAGLVTRYEVQGRKYLSINNFSEHQHPKKKLHSKLPAPGKATIPPPVPPISPTPYPPVAPVVVEGVGEVVVEGVGVNSLSAVADAPPVLALSLDEPPPPNPRRVLAKPKRPSVAEFPLFTQERFVQWHRLWEAKRGPVDPGRFRKAMGPLFRLPESERDPKAPTDAELFDAFEHWLLSISKGRSSAFCKPEKCAEELVAVALAARGLG